MLEAPSMILRSDLHHADMCGLASAMDTLAFYSGFPTVLTPAADVRSYECRCDYGAQWQLGVIPRWRSKGFVPRWSRTAPVDSPARRSVGHRQAAHCTGAGVQINGGHHVECLGLRISVPPDCPAALSRLLPGVQVQSAGDFMPSGSGESRKCLWAVARPEPRFRTK